MSALLYQCDRATEMREHLSEAQRHVDLGALHIIRQREIIVELEQEQLCDTAEMARGLLAALEDVQAFLVVNRDRLRGNLAKLRSVVLRQTLARRVASSTSAPSTKRKPRSRR